MRPPHLLAAPFLLLACHCGASREGHHAVHASQVSAETTRLAWRELGPRVLGVDERHAYGWQPDAEGNNTLVMTSLRVGTSTSMSLRDAPYVGEPRAWFALENQSFSVGHWDGLARVWGRDENWAADPPTQPYSTAQRTGDRTFVVADVHEVAMLAFASSGHAHLWRTPMPPAAQIPELFVDDTTVGLVFQQYDANAATTVLSIPHRVRSLSREDGQVRWTRDFVENLGAVHVAGDVIVIAEGADLVFLDGPSGEERARHRALGAPNIYPEIISDAQRIVVALEGFVRAYDLEGALLWATPVAHVSSGAELAMDAENVYVTTSEGSLVRLSLRDGREAWRIGTAIASGSLWLTEDAVLIDGGSVRVGIPLPRDEVQLEHAHLEGRVLLGACTATDVHVIGAGRDVPVADDGTFALDVDAVGYLGVTAARTALEESEQRLPCEGASTVISLDGSRSYTVTLRACCP